jgi:hypothetical protein
VKGVWLKAGIAAVAAAAFMLLQQPGRAVDSTETIGAEKCGRGANAYELEFLAPDNATVEATAKVMLKGAPVERSDSVALSLDGKGCTAGRCGFQAKKGETYRLSATTVVPNADELCIVVARPSRG